MPGDLVDQLMKCGASPEAVQRVRALLVEHPDHFPLQCRLGDLLAALERPEEAMAAYQHASRLRPRAVEPCCGIGQILLSQGKLAPATVWLNRALEADPNCARAQFELGRVHLEQGEFAAARSCFFRVIQQHPELATAHFNLGVAEDGDGRLDAAVASYREAIRLDPQAIYFNNLGTVLGRLERYDEAAQVLSEAVSVDSGLESAWVNLARVHLEQGRPESAVECCRRALTFHQGSDNLLSLEAECWLQVPSVPDAIDSLQRARRIRPDRIDLHMRLGFVYDVNGQLTQAARCYQDALRLAPEHAEAHSNLGEVRRAQGRLADALACQRRALEFRPDLADVHSNMLLTQLYDDDQTPQGILHAAVAWAGKFADPIAPVPARAARASGRRLKVGYVSRDLRRHPVGYFIAPVLACHDRERFEVHCYVHQEGGDDWTGRIRGSVECWNEVSTENDAELARHIHEDGIDILVDLSGHTGFHRLLTFARKPAPVQVTWLGYSSTTGLAEMDYLVADRWVVPSSDQDHYREKVFRLPDHYLCCAVPDVEVAPRGAGRGDAPFTYGCFNNRAKLTPKVIQLWAEILGQVPASHLFLKTRALADHDTRAALVSEFVGHGISADRLRLEGSSPRGELLAAYRDVDLCLDPFPFNGGITTFEALWMGVPVLTLRGDRFAARAGETFLAAVGLHELVADSPRGYKSGARQLADDAAHLQRLRTDLRQRLLDSPLCDYRAFTRDLEAAYGQMFAEGTGDTAHLSPRPE